MKRMIYAYATFIFLSLCLTVPGMAQVQETAIGNTFGVGARTMGMGGASLGLADDFTALYWNPAGMAQIQKFEFFSSLSHNYAAIDTYFTGDEKTAATHSQMRLNSLGIVYPFQTRRGGWAIGFGYNRPQNFDEKIAIQGIDPSSGTDFSGLAVDETTLNRGGIGIWSFGTSVYISKNVLLGGALDFWQGSSLYELDSEAKDILNVDSDLSHFRYDDAIDREYSGVGARVGLLAHLTDNVSVGLNFVAPVDLSVDEHWYQYTKAVYDDGEETSDSVSGVQAFDIERPLEIGAGVAVKALNRRLILAADVQFTDWTQTRYAPAPADDVPADNFEEYYASSLQLRVGAEYRIPVIETYIRLGYFRDADPFQDPLKDPDIVDARDYITAGIGKIFEESLKLDVGYMLKGRAERTTDGLAVEELAHRVLVSAAYRY